MRLRPGAAGRGADPPAPPTLMWEGCLRPSFSCRPFSWRPSSFPPASFRPSSPFSLLVSGVMWNPTCAICVVPGGPEQAMERGEYVLRRVVVTERQHQAQETAAIFDDEMPRDERGEARL